jgi:hypothetical protein
MNFASGTVAFPATEIARIHRRYCGIKLTIFLTRITKGLISFCDEIVILGNPPTAAKETIVGRQKRIYLFDADAIVPT